jgi:hypothetical protein
MDLPSELYAILYGLADEIGTTKALRLVSKRSLAASYWYFKTLLSRPVHIHYHGFWSLSCALHKSDEEVQSETKAYDLLRLSRGILLLDHGDEFDEITIFRMTTKELLNKILF